MLAIISQPANKPASNATHTINIQTKQTNNQPTNNKNWIEKKTRDTLHQKASTQI